MGAGDCQPAGRWAGRQLDRGGLDRAKTQFHSAMKRLALLAQSQSGAIALKQGNAKPGLKGDAKVASRGKPKIRAGEDAKPGR